MKSSILLLAILIPVLIWAQIPKKPITLDELKIEVSGPSREVAYTNKQSGYYYTETNAEHHTGWQGWHIMSVKMMDDYRIAVNGEPLRKQDVDKTEVYPDKIHRSYKNGLQEIFTMLDSIDALVVELKNIRGSSVSVSPLFDHSRTRDDYIIKWKQKVLLVAKKRHQEQSAKENYPVWIGITSVPLTTPIDVFPDSIDEPPRYGPVRLSSRVWHSGITFVIVAGDSIPQTITLARDVARRYPSLIHKRKQRMENLLNESYIRTDNPTFTKSLQWAKISMDALIMNQLKKGIFAGLPWFDNYWGRDSYISLPGATLVTGKFKEAKQILESFAEWQDKDEKSPTFGRIPNLVTTNSIAYNTADGTPWFTISAGEYIRYSGDTAFVREIFPAIRLGIEGSITKRTDDKCFLTHGDAETWMDAVGPDGPWSPRGNRANDIQSLWYRQLQTGAMLARSVGDTASSTRWGKFAATLLSNFNTHFIATDSDNVYDHLMADGSADRQFRPNQLFTLNLIADPALRARIFKNVTERLVYPHGIASLWQEDPNFHPYHHFEPAYVQDAAYHNGIVWTWLAGRWIDEAAEYGYSDLAFDVTKQMIHQMLDRGAVGTISELLDAAPRPGESEPRLSGAFSQAWGLAEFIRVAYQSYLGMNVDAPAHKIFLHPRLPSEITDVVCDIPMGPYKINSTYHLERDSGEIVLQSQPGLPDIDVELELPTVAKVLRTIHVHLPSNTTITILVRDQKITEKISAESTDIQPVVLDISRPELSGIHLAVPVVRQNLRALQPPKHRMLSHAEIKASDSGSVALYDVTDPAGDDTGTSGYIYPTSPNLKSGSLDITHFNVSADKNNIYFRLNFRNLSNPGWHPEYGYQLTFGAIAIDKDGIPGSGQRHIGRNGSYILDSSDAFENIIYIGGGIRVEDAAGNVLCEYQPAAGDEKNPLGSIQTKSVSFAIPVEIIGVPTTLWRYTVLIGAQDDHGGAGIGEFRTVGSEVGEWVGGGKKKPDDPNVYDFIFPVKQK